jgi:hypothetical protein
VRRQFFEADAISDDAYRAMDPTMWFGAEANGRILTILGQMPTEPVTVAAFQRLADTLVGWWDADDDRHRDQHPEHPKRSHETESALINLLENLLLRTTAVAATTILQPILHAVDGHPANVHWLLRGLIGVEDRQPNTPQFWSLWELFADRVRRARWLARIDDEHTSGHEMMSAIFLGSCGRRRSATGGAWRGTQSTFTRYSTTCPRLRRSWTTIFGSSTTSVSNRSQTHSSASRSVYSRGTPGR